MRAGSVKLLLTMNTFRHTTQFFIIKDCATPWKVGHYNMTQATLDS